MRRTIKFSVFIIFMFAPLVWAQDDSISVLFMGNSHTYYNNLPTLFSNLSASGGKVVTTDMSAPGGYTLEQHTTNETTLQKISQGGWDYVVLQEQSEYPVIEYYRFNSMYPAAHHLDSLIAQVGARTVLYMTWGWRNGGIHTINGHSSPEFVDYFHMQDSVSAAYRMLTTELGSILSPAGEAWATARHQDTTINFWQPDTYHPTLEGSYLAACVFYNVLFDESPIGLRYNPGLDDSVMAFLQRAADQTVSGISDDHSQSPFNFTLLGNYPNPFNSSTTIAFSLDSDLRLSMAIYDILGRQVVSMAEKEYSAGYHTISWDGKSDNGLAVSSGRYFIVARCDNRQKMLPITLLK